MTPAIRGICLSVALAVLACSCLRAAAAPAEPEGAKSSSPVRMKPVERYCEQILTMDSAGLTDEQTCGKCCEQKAGKWEYSWSIANYCYCKLVQAK